MKMILSLLYVTCDISSINHMQIKDKFQAIIPQLQFSTLPPDIVVHVMRPLVLQDQRLCQLLIRLIINQLLSPLVLAYKHLILKKIPIHYILYMFYKHRVNSKIC